MIKNSAGCIAFLLLASLPVCVVAGPNGASRWEPEIAAFERSDKTNLPPVRANLFVGSSSIRLWTNLVHDFPAHQVINRGFGGSELSDAIYYFDRIVAKYQPRTIVLFAGSNDINSGKSPEQVFADFKEFASKVAQELPETRLAYISISTSPSRFGQVENVRSANRLIAEFIKAHQNMEFIDVFPAMLDVDGKPKAEIYQKDKLHLNAAGYAIWQKLVEPCLD
jgi:lysophospholipase L1-like esterase